jgi:epoxyqueuosine reductase
MSLSQDIKCKALKLGFDLVGITDTSPIDAKQVKLLTDWLKSGFAGQMSYLRRNLQMRINPAKLLENAQSVIVVGLNYKPPKHSPSLRASPKDARQSHHGKFEIASPTSGGLAMTVPAGKIASYAQYEDYHLFIKKQLHKLSDFINSVTGTNYKFKICVDSAPLAERALAVRAGLGFIGKNHLLINPILGPQVFLGEIITNLELKPLNGSGSLKACPEQCRRAEGFGDGRRQAALDAATHRQTLNATDTSRATVRRKTQPVALCEYCSNCISACPTGALHADGRFDATKCINYLTIEYKGRISTELAEKIGDRLFGCEECILACPYQQNAPVCKNKQFKSYGDRAELDLQEILELTDKEFKRRFADSVIKRLGLAGLQRNARICLSNV